MLGGCKVRQAAAEPGQPGGTRRRPGLAQPGGAPGAPSGRPGRGFGGRDAPKVQGEFGWRLRSPAGSGGQRRSGSDLLKDSNLRSWYTENRMAHSHGITKRVKSVLEMAWRLSYDKLRLYIFANMGGNMGLKMVIYRDRGRFPK